MNFFHHVAFLGVVVIMQVTIRNGEPLFEVNILMQVTISNGEPLFQVDHTDGFNMSDDEEELVDNEDNNMM